jgi:transposase
VYHDGDMIRRGKTDAADAAAICEAVMRPHIAFRANEDRRPTSGFDAA